MIIGTCQIVLAIPGRPSLKAKRKVVRSLVDRVRHRFHVSVAEVADQDVHQRGVVGIAVVSEDRRHANSMLSKIIEFIQSASGGPVLDIRLELIDVAGEAAFGSEWSAYDDEEP